MNTEISRIAYLQGASGERIQRLLHDCGRKLAAHGIKVCGVAELPQQQSDDGLLNDIASPQRFQIYQDLGKGSQSCTLDACGLSAAAGFVEAQLDAACGLLIVSKFGKVEAEGKGFCGAFRKAMLLDIPVLTSVNPNLNPQWLNFSGGLACRTDATAAAIQDWWRSVEFLSSQATMIGSCPPVQKPSFQR